MSLFQLLTDSSEDLLLGASAASERLVEQLDRVARTPRTTVLLLGERGRELELVARSIHARSEAGGASRAFLPRAACTFASTSERGAGSLTELFERVVAGTVFLDEVRELDSEQQAELLVQLERGREAADQARLIAATSGDLGVEVEAGRFQEELFYRLNVLTVRVPALRDRPEDIDRIASAVLARIHATLGGPSRLEPDALFLLKEYDWPGGLLELESALVAASVRAASEGKPALKAAHLVLESRSSSRDDALFPAPPSGSRKLRDLEEAMIRRVLVEEQGNRSRAARSLGINRTTLYNKLRLYDIA